MFLNVSGSPRKISNQVRWQVVVGDDDMVVLESGGDFASFAGTLFVCAEEPRLVSHGVQGQAPANGAIDCDSSRTCYQIELWVSQETFAQVSDLAMRGIFPMVTLTFKDGCGIEYAGAPDGALKNWDNVRRTHVPIAEFSLRYTVPSMRAMT
jgi:hypothetical protein